ncbi:unnamed protein product [Adineta steineri]|uniref:Rab-GAP TBC domain-containing protein n=1 Tax=Adineta steineri TaxID=433720 RepID=A0A815EL45_9BILA|nr:unnamed protein product [Adineta steineri]CAF1313457.1 unnamed protein product [Adineta steineri]CAF3588742.1 unnamed protein product [Adineta steineri]CAF3803395.1 unnamed protein product [Adineta steineri]CAF3994913.1 unnamed protein product [Adineta steineri]
MSILNKKIPSVPSTPRNNQISSSKNSVTSIIRRASNLLTQRTTSFGGPNTTTSLLKNKCPPLDGEIVFSKNNICVHPPSRLHSYTLHHPGYLCIKCQNSPEFGSTLILTWIPNSTLKNRSNTSQQSPTSDEISSPSINTNLDQPPTSTPRHSLSRTIDSGYHASNSNHPLLSPIEQEENLDRRHSSDDQYEDALDDKSYMRQESITSDLTEGPDEILDEQDVDDAFDSIETNDQSSNRVIDDSLPFMKETNSWKNATGICEPNSSMIEDDEAIRTVAEQFCGVFSVDLGKMRSLRLFYCDDTPSNASGSGQLVIASCESQYKVLHFHNGGLDRLIEILNEWNLFAYEKTRRGFANCHQFNVVRPTIDSSDLHPEEGCYHLITIDNWRTYMNSVGQIEDNHQLRKTIFFAGIDPSIAREVWPFLLHLYPFDSTFDQREQIRHNKFIHYQKIRARREAAINDPEQVQFFHDVEAIIEKDVVRTDRSHPYFKGDDNPNLRVMKEILMNYAAYCPTMGYNQGMSDLLAPILTLIQNESDAFWCFVGLMNRTIFISTPTDDVMEKQLRYLRELLSLMLPAFHEHCSELSDGLDLLFAHRWILLCFKREFPEREALRMWEACWSHYQTDYFHLFICISIMAVYGDDIVQQNLGTDDMLLHFNSLAMHMSGSIVLKKARSLLYKFRLLQRIPCCLHDISVLAGPGNWDSHHVPQIYCICTTVQEKERCPFSGICM